MRKIISQIVLGLAVICLCGTASASAVRFKIKVDPSVMQANQSLSGRLLVFMTSQKQPLEMIEPDFLNPQGVWVTGLEVTSLEPGKTIEVDADVLAFPSPFSEAPAGDYQVMGLLDADHSYTYAMEKQAGDAYSDVVRITMPSNETVLTLSKIVPEQKRTIPANAKLIEFESPSLSAFWGRPIRMLASVLLPPSYDKSRRKTYPTVYIVHGYGGNYLGPLQSAPAYWKAMSEGQIPELIYVYLNARSSLGHTVFADSANNGPWGSALTKELIPYLEKRFRMDARPSGRFLTGHSSGGWTTLWLQITYPDFFGGTWSTAPDPVDFHNFTGPDLTQYPPQNFYHDTKGKSYNLVRMDGKEVMSLEEYAKLERVLGYFGGQMASFEAVFSPKGPDGQPMTLFNRDTGGIDPFVQKAWEKFDISKILRDNWTTLGPKLKGKLHIIVGTADTFHLDEGVHLLDAELKKLGSNAKIRYIEGRDHFNLYQGGLNITPEMYAVARPKAKAAMK